LQPAKTCTASTADLLSLQQFFAGRTLLTLQCGTMLAGSAEADVRSAETIAQQRTRIGELEGQAAALQRQLAAAHQQAEALEGRLAAAEAAAARAAAEVGRATFEGIQCDAALCSAEGGVGRMATDGCLLIVLQHITVQFCIG
jgi:chromosome segregation ATPase